MIAVVPRHFRPLRALVLLLALVANLALAASATYSARTGEIRDFHSPSAGVVLAATQGGGLYRWTDASGAWASVATLPERYVWRITGSRSDPALLFAATNQGLYRSVDGGSSWQHITYEDTRAIAVDRTNDQVVVIGVPGAGLYRSTDRGLTFRAAQGGLDSTDVTSLDSGPTANTFYAGLYSNPSGGWGGVFQSTDGGATWTSWNGGGAGALPSKYVTAVVVMGSGAVLAATYDPASGGRVYRRVGGGNWTASFAAATSGVLALHADRANANTAWAGLRVQGVYRSTDDGASFAPRSNATQDVFTDVLAVGSVLGTTNRVLVGAGALGVYASSDGGATWPKSSNGLLADRVTGFAGSATDRFIGTAGGGVHRSVDGGVTYTPVLAGLSNPVYGPRTFDIVGMAGTAATVYAGAMGFGGLFQWDGASAWGRVNESGLPNDASGYWNPVGVTVDPANAQVAYYTLFDGAQAGVYRRNGGPVWSKVRNIAGAGPVVRGAAGQRRWYILNFGALPDRSTDDGSTWAPVSIPAASQFGFTATSFFAIAEHSSAPSLALASTNKGLFASSDGGATWSAKSTAGLLSTELTGLVAVGSMSQVFATDRAGRFYCTLDGGAGWVVKETVRASIVGLQLDGAQLDLLTDGGGVLQRDATCP